MHRENLDRTSCSNPFSIFPHWFEATQKHNHCTTSDQQSSTHHSHNWLHHQQSHGFQLLNQAISHSLKAQYILSEILCPGTKLAGCTCNRQFGSCRLSKYYLLSADYALLLKCIINAMYALSLTMKPQDASTLRSSDEGMMIMEKLCRAKQSEILCGSIYLAVIILCRSLSAYESRSACCSVLEENSTTHAPVQHWLTEQIDVPRLGCAAASPYLVMQ